MCVIQGQCSNVNQAGDFQNSHSRPPRPEGAEGVSVTYKFAKLFSRFVIAVVISALSGACLAGFSSFASGINQIGSGGGVCVCGCRMAVNENQIKQGVTQRKIWQN